MKIEIYEQRVLIPDNGMWLYNAQAGVISKKVYLGVEADASAWVEITEEKKLEIEQKEAAGDGV